MKTLKDHKKEVKIGVPKRELKDGVGKQPGGKTKKVKKEKENANDTQKDATTAAWN